jgi:superfamily II DNA/RNA helicase
LRPPLPLAAAQVAAVFQPLCTAVGLDVAVASGKGPLHAEAAALVGAGASSCIDVLVITPGRCVPSMRGGC